jgi:uncharacterized phiE125 gp8 family phage protein
MALVTTSPPSVEPLSLSEVKAHLRVDRTVDDVLLGSLVLTSRLHVEAALGLALITQGQKWTLDRWPGEGRGVDLPVRPVQSITSISVVDVAGVPQVVAPELYDLDGAASPARLILKAGAWPRAGQDHLGIEIELVAGFGPAATDVPEPIRQALLLLVAHWFEHRDPVEIGSTKTSVPEAVSDLLQPYRQVRL